MAGLDNISNKAPTPFTIPVDLNNEEKRNLLLTHLVLSHCKKRFEDVFSFFDATMDVVHTSLYKNKNRFRNDKSYKGLVMVQKRCKMLRKFPLLIHLENFKNQLPHGDDIKNRDRHYLPTQNHLKHWLTIHQESIEQCQKIVGYCKHTAKYLQMRLQTGHFWNWAMFMYANIGRIWSLAQALIANLHLSYEHHLAVIDIFPMGSTQGLFDQLDFKSCPLAVPEQLTKDFPKLDQVLMECDKPEVQFVGEIISRRACQETKAPTNDKYLLRVKKSLKHIKSMDTLKQFLIDETKSRQECRKKAITKKLDQKDWKELKSSIRAKMELEVEISSLKAALISWILCPNKKESCLENYLEDLTTQFLCCS